MQSPESPLPPPKERRRLRESRSLTQAHVAGRIGVNRETVRAWETGRTTPRGRAREAYAQLLESFATDTTDATGTTDPADPADPTDRHEVVPAEEMTTSRPKIPPQTAPLSPAQAFDALYAFCAPALVRQTYLLTGRRELARESVERAFQLAWQQWPQVARDRDPAGWARATAYEYALSPWHRFRPRYRHPATPPADAADRALLHALLRLPPSYRRTLVLYDGVGLGLPETAAETEASTPAAANRLTRARAAVAKCVPELSDPAALHRRLAELASTEHLRAARPTTVRTVGERRTRFWTRAAIAFTAAIVCATSLTLRTAPTRYEAPIGPAQAVLGVPPRAALGPLSGDELHLRAKLRAELRADSVHGPERLMPLPR